MTKIALKTYALLVVCKNFEIANGEKATSQKFVISFRTLSGLKLVPTGFCIQAFATKIQNALRLLPIATSHVERRWNFGETLFQPKNITAKNVASRKNAISPSIAKGAPKISPTNQE